MNSGHLETGTAVGDFEILERIGSGGMGIVYKARSRSLNRVVALKILGPRLDASSGAERFRREAKAIAQLKHQGIATVHYIGQDSDVCYLAMEYVDGLTLQEVVQALSQNTEHDSIESVLSTPRPKSNCDHERFDIPTTIADNTEQTQQVVPEKRTLNDEGFVCRCAEIVREAALAIEHAHKAKVVHRDIKPGNLMLDSSGRVVVIDFGLARYYDDATLTHTGQLIGTPIYMSPEQVTGRVTVDHRSDIYSLGLVLYEMLSLMPPISAETREDVFRIVATKQLTPISWKNRAVSMELEAIVHKATSRDADDRYQSATELADDLQNFLSESPVTANPYRFKADNSEVILARPEAVLHVGMAFIGLGAIVFAVGFGLLMTWLYLASRGSSLFLGNAGRSTLVSFGFAVVGAAALYTGKGLLVGRRWATYVAGCTSIVIGCGVLMLMGRVVYFSGTSSILVTGLATVTGCGSVIASVMAVRAMTGKQTRKWLGLADRMRSDHRKIQTNETSS